MEDPRRSADGCPRWNAWTRIWFGGLGIVGVMMPWFGLALEINSHGLPFLIRHFKVSEWLMVVAAIMWDLFLFKLVRSHVKLALLLFDGLNCLVGLGIILGEKGSEDGLIISSFFFGIAFVTWLSARNSLRKDTIRDSIEEIKGM